MAIITIRAGEHKELKERQGISYIVDYNGERLGEWIDNVILNSAQRLLDFYGLGPRELLFIYNEKNQLIFREKTLAEFSEKGKQEFEFGQSFKIIRSKKPKYNTV